jgi:hypothetical protein
LENDRQSYRQTASPARRVIGYQTASGASKIDERALNPTTVWRMITWLGSQLVAWRLGLRLLIQRDPHSTCHRFVGAVAPHKSRSPRREQTLRQARRLLHLNDQWENHFSEPFFPRFATRSGFD